MILNIKQRGKIYQIKHGKYIVYVCKIDKHKDLRTILWIIMKENNPKKMDNIYIPSETNKSTFDSWKYTGKFLRQKNVLNFLIENIFGKDSKWEKDSDLWIKFDKYLLRF